jgi:hypothetical protein
MTDKATTDKKDPTAAELELKAAEDRAARIAASEIMKPSGSDQQKKPVFEKIVDAFSQKAYVSAPDKGLRLELDKDDQESEDDEQNDENLNEDQKVAKKKKQKEKEKKEKAKGANIYEEQSEVQNLYSEDPSKLIFFNIFA